MAVRENLFQFSNDCQPLQKLRE